MSDLPLNTRAELVEAVLKEAPPEGLYVAFIAEMAGISNAEAYEALAEVGARSGGAGTGRWVLRDPGGRSVDVPADGGE